MRRFEGVETQVLGLSVDSKPCLQAWAESLGGITYPLLSDFYPHGATAQLYGVLRKEGYSERALFIIDKSGVIRYVDIHDIDHQPDNEELFKVLYELEPSLAKAARAAEEADLAKAPMAAAEPKADIIIYCTPWCPDCRRARTYLTTKGIPFAEVDITHDKAAAQFVRSWNNGKEVTPTIKIKGTVLTGFTQDRFIEALQKANML